MLNAIIASLSTYSAIPMPNIEWSKKTTQYAICFFPIVGIIIGGLLSLWYLFSYNLGVSGILFSAVAAALPILVSGGIHMDGFMDTVDALASHSSCERRLAILKDPRAGAFAVIFCVVYMIAAFALYFELYIMELVFPACFVFVISRALSAFLAITMKNARAEGMLATFIKHTNRRAALFSSIVTATVFLLPIMLLCVVGGAISAALAIICLFWYRRMATRRFGGATGDTAGFFLVMCELFMLLGLVFGGIII